MSIELMNAVRRSEISVPAQKFLMFALADYANDEMECWPSVAKLQEYTAFKPRTIEGHLKAMTDAGWITRKRLVRPDGKLSVYRYKIHPQNLPVAKSASGKKLQKPPAESAAQEPPIEPPITNANALVTRDAPEHVSEQPKPKPKPKRKSTIRGSTRGSRMSGGWAPGPEDYAYAKKSGLSTQEINHEANQFRDYHLAKGTISKSWPASWRTWCRNAIKYRNERRQPAAYRRSASGLEALDRLAERLEGSANRQPAQPVGELAGSSSEIIDITPIGSARAGVGRA